jgi:hypothetical protein
MAVDIRIDQHIRDLLTVARELKQRPGVDKKALNKTIARLEEAELWAGKIWSPGHITGPAPRQQINGSEQGETPEGCICPRGAVYSGCPAITHKMAD